MTARRATLVRPAVLGEIPARGHAVIEASAGTGKTYTIEHLVLDRVLAGDEVSSCLVVTFSEKAALELRARVRGTLARALRALRDAAEPEPGAPPGPVFLLDEVAGARLERALATFESATISTIHAFCQRTLAAHALDGGLPFTQALVDERRLFSRAFRAVLRRALAPDTSTAALVSEWLDEGKGLDALEGVLFASRRASHGSREPRGARERERDPARDVVRALRAHLSSAELDGARLSLAVARAGLPPVREARLRDALASLVSAVAAGGGAIDFEGLALTVEGKGRGKQKPIELEQLPRALRRVLLVVQQLAPLPPSPVPVREERLVAELGPLIDDELARHRAKTGSLDFGDLVGELARALSGEAGERLSRSVRERTKTVLIDEFQDTDELQWSVFRALFLRDATPSEPSVLVIGDPKQAIYAFRGADVFAYLDATAELRERGAVTVHLTQSFRSSPPLLEAIARLLDREGPAPLLEGIIEATHDVSAGHASLGVFRDGVPTPPLVVHRVGPRVAEAGGVTTTVARDLVCASFVRTIEAIVSGETTFGLEGRRRRAVLGDVLVLTRSGFEAARITLALRERGIPVASSSLGDVLRSREARDVLTVLRALAEPDDDALALAALATPFFAVPWSFLPTMSTLPVEHPAWARLRGLARLAEARRYRELFQALRDESGVRLRELALDPHGESRHVLDAVLDALRAEVAARDTPVGELARALSAFIDGRAAPPELELARPAPGEAVRVMTMHASKGLEAPFVFLFGGYGEVYRREAVTQVHEGFRRTVLPYAAQAGLAAQKAEREQLDEAMRLTYVALTRAKVELHVALVSPSALRGRATLARAYRPLAARLEALVAEHERASLEQVEGASGASTSGRALGLLDLSLEPPLAPRAPSPPLEQTLDALEAALSPSLFGAPPSPSLAAAAPLVAASYSSLKLDTARADARPRSFADTALPVPALAHAAEDELVGEALDPRAPTAALRALPGGRTVGSLVHLVLERLPLELVAAAESVDALARAPSVLELVRAQCRAVGVSDELSRAVLDLAYRTLRAPLPLAGGPCLAELSPRRELEFTFPVGASREGRALAQGARLGAMGQGAGYVRGYIDAVLEHEGVAYVLDYKSDRLPSWDEAALSAHVDASYDLQAKLYAIALRRLYRVTNERSFASKIGGVLFFFVRAQDELGPGAGILRRTPSFAELAALEDELPSRLEAQPSAFEREPRVARARGTR